MKTTNSTTIWRRARIMAAGLALVLACGTPVMAEDPPPEPVLRPHPYDYLKELYEDWNTPSDGQTRYAEIHAVLDKLAAALPESEGAIKTKIAAAKVCLDEMRDQLKDDKLTDLTGTFAALSKYYREHLTEIKAAPESNLAKAFYFAGDRNDMQGEPRSYFGWVAGEILGAYIHWYANIADYNIAVPARAKLALLDLLEWVFPTQNPQQVGASYDLEYIFASLKTEAFARMDAMTPEHRKTILAELNRLTFHSENWDPEGGEGPPIPESPRRTAAKQALAEALAKYSITLPPLEE